MRHQTIRQTDGYTDDSQLPIYEAVKGLPPLIGYTQIRAQILGSSWQNGAQPGATAGNSKSVKPLKTKGSVRVWRSVASCLR
jgi:hypothetical protein